MQFYNSISQSTLDIDLTIPACSRIFMKTAVYPNKLFTYRRIIESLISLTPSPFDPALHWQLVHLNYTSPEGENDNKST